LGREEIDKGGDKETKGGEGRQQTRRPADKGTAEERRYGDKERLGQGGKEEKEIQDERIIKSGRL
jgi:hypothetical protein